MRRFTRLTNAFSKKVENHAHAVALHFLHYNLARPHQSLWQADHPCDGCRRGELPQVGHPGRRAARGSGSKLSHYPAVRLRM